MSTQTQSQPDREMLTCRGCGKSFRKSSSRFAYRLNCQVCGGQLYHSQGKESGRKPR